MATEPNGNQAAAPIAFSDNGLGPEGRFRLRVSGLPPCAIVAVIARRMRASGLWRAVRREAASAGPMRGQGGWLFFKKPNVATRGERHVRRCETNPRVDCGVYIYPE